MTTPDKTMMIDGFDPERFTAACDKLSGDLHKAFEDALPSYLDALGEPGTVPHAAAMAGITGAIRELTETALLQIPVEHRMAISLHYVSELSGALYELNGLTPPNDGESESAEGGEQDAA